MLNVQVADERDDRFLAYSTSQENGNEPPSGMTNRIRSGDKYDQKIYFFGAQHGTIPKKKPGPYSVYVELYTKKPYTRLVIKEISYFYEGKTGLVVENAEFSLGDYMIVQSLKDLNTYYLLVHLAYTSWNTYGIKKGMTITP